jgi:anaerobic selenocysteine-containing dehydrogenase
MEDSTACIHASRGAQEPASEHLKSEPAIVAGIAKATLTRGNVDWDRWVADYSLIRDAIEQTYPEQFGQFNQRFTQPGGFPRPNKARERKWNTKTKKANFIVPRGLDEDPDAPALAQDVLQLITLRSNDQFNTTIYGYHDRFRGVKGTRQIVFMNRGDMLRLGIPNGEKVNITTAVSDGIERTVSDMLVIEYNIPEGCCAGYYPECNPLLPLWHHAERSKVPAAKSIPVNITRA